MKSPMDILVEIQTKLFDGLYSIATRMSDIGKTDRRAKIGTKIIDRCVFCKYVVIQKNVWGDAAKNFPTYQCSEHDMKFIYNQRSIPRWCKYVIKRK